MMVMNGTASSVLSGTGALLSPRRQSSKGKARRNSNNVGGDDDDDVLVIDSAGEDAADDYSYYQWIPSLLFESACYKDSDDSEMRSRVIMLMDDLLLGSELPHDKKRHLTSTARATGMAIVVDGIRGHSSKAWHWMENLLSTRAKLQSTLKEYIDARGRIRNHVVGKL
jgi:hypothetical protein